MSDYHKRMADVDRFNRIVQVWDHAQSVFGFDESAASFLTRSHHMLHGKTPLQVTEESWEGAYEVRQILGRIEHGIVS